METETTAWSGFRFSNGGKATVEQIIGLKRKKEIYKSRTGESQSGIVVAKLSNWVESFEIGKV